MLSFTLLLFMSAMPTSANDDIRVSPLYFGPNALPVPEMLDGTVSDRLYVEVSYDFYKGFYGDKTHDLNAKVHIPLFTPSVNLTLWMPVVEFYYNTPASIDHQASVKQKMKGSGMGNVYVTTDIHLFKQKRIMPDVSLRVGLITASGDNEQYARYYDAPGYFFDTSVAKSLKLKKGFVREVRFVVNAGFLCWQVAKSIQNDAYMYGLKAKVCTGPFDCSFAWQGYSGWIGNGDKPMVIRADAVWKLGRKGNIRPLVSYQYGVRDYPFHQLRVGMGYRF